MSTGDGAERGGPRFQITEEDVRRPDIVELIRTHLAFAAEVTPEGHVHALDVDGLARSGARFYSARRDGALMGIGAMKLVAGDPLHVEVKSMHTARAARGLGVGQALLDALLAEARASGAQRVRRGAGTQGAFAPARGRDGRSRSTRTTRSASA